MTHRLFSLLALCISCLGLVACDHSPERVDVYRVVGDENSEVPVLPPPFTAAETTALRSSFNWNTTTDLATTDDQGRPALYYALVLVHDREDLDTLELARIYHDAMPLFPEELARWDEWDTGSLDPTGDDHGLFVFAFLPGEAYNEIRRAALANEPTFEAVLLREVPDPTALAPGGYLNLDVLAERGCTFGFTSQELASAAAMSSDSGMSTSPLLGRLVRSLVRIGRAAANAVRWVAAKVRLKRDFTFRMRVVNSDAVFVDPSRSVSSPADDRNILRSGWGASRGEPVVPHGAMVVVRTNMSMTMERLNSRGEVSMRIPRDKEFTVFLRLLNSAAVITVGSLADRRIKLHRGDFGVHERDKPIDVHFDVRERSVHELAILTEAHDFAVRQLHEDPRRAVIVDGPINATSHTSSTACWSYFGFGTTAFGHGRGWSLAGATAGRIFADFDMVVRGDDAKSRGAVTHEYGHYLMCHMINEVSYRDFGRAYGEVVQETVTNPGGSPTDQARMLAEGWADFYASEVVGATSYYDLRGGVSDDYSMSYCDSTQYSRTDPCNENNLGGRGGIGGIFPMAVSPPNDPEDLVIGTFATLMVDAFDAPGIDPNALNNNVQWSFRAGLDSGFPAQGLAFDDEVVSLDGRDLRAIVKGWSAGSDRLSFAPFYNSLASVLTDSFDPAEVCQMFALHEHNGDCTMMASVLGTISHSPPAPIFGFRVTTNLNAAATSPLVSATWSLLDPSATSVGVNVVQGGTQLVHADLPFALNGSWSSSTALPFNSALLVRLTATLADGTVSAPISASVFTAPEPVRTVTPTGIPNAISVVWTATAATSYRVKVTNTVTGVVTWQNSNTPYTLVDFLDPYVLHTVEVYSVNAVGEVSTVPSPIQNVVTDGLG